MTREPSTQLGIRSHIPSVPSKDRTGVLLLSNNLGLQPPMQSVYYLNQARKKTVTTVIAHIGHSERTQVYD